MQMQMQIHMLLTPEIEVPVSPIQILINWGEVILHNGVKGQHILVEGKSKEISNWLNPYNGVWVGEGPPQLQHFTAMHVK